MKFSQYCKGKWSLFFLYGLVFFVLTISFLLYQLPILAVAYPMGLGLLLVALYLLWDYRAEKKRVMDEGALRGQLDELRRELLDAQQKNHQRMEYYTLWVHQIKTPIAAMRLSLQERDDEHGRKLSYDLNRIEQYADMVMTYLRLDSDSTDYVFRNCDLDQIIKGAIRKFSGEFIARKISLDYVPVDRVVLTDEKWLSFVLEQILSNALKYTPAGRISVYMEAPLTLCVRDTGIGIAPEDLPRIFEQGFTGGNGRIDRKASGIGLYLCKRICGKLGHGISARSEPGKGTTIQLDLKKNRVEPN